MDEKIVKIQLRIFAAALGIIVGSEIAQVIWVWR